MNVFSADVALAITRLGLLILLGWFMARQGWVGAHARQPLMRMIIWVFFPAMIFSRVSGNPLIASGSQALLYLGAGFLLIVTGYAVAMAIGLLFKVPAGTARRTFAFSAGVNNFGYLGIPVTAALFKNDDVVGVLLVHNVGVEAAVWTVGIAMLSGESLRKGLKKLFQPMTVALFVALAINFAGFGKSASIVFASDLCHVIGDCAIPIGTLLTGIYLHEIIKDFRLVSDAPVSFGVMAVRWLLMPLLVLATVNQFVTDESLRKVMLVQAAMPCGIFTFLIVEMFKGDVMVSLRCSVITMLCCPLVTPVWLYLGARWLGLS
jgi:predicted permease